jgi:hypothetical protein
MGLPDKASSWNSFLTLLVSHRSSNPTTALAVVPAWIKILDEIKVKT